MTETADAVIHQTPLRDRHVALGAKLIEFGGWLMPVQYAGILEEHRAVRERAGLFDLSHMGELFVEGAEAGDGARRRARHEPAALCATGRAHYSMICAPDGGDHRRPDRLPPRGGALPRRRERVERPGRERRAGRAARGLPGGPRRPLARHGARRDPGPARGRDRHAADRRRPRRAPLLRDRRGHGRGDPGARRPDRLHRRGRLRGVRRDRPGRRALGRPDRRRASRTACCRSAWARATRSGSRPGCRSTATSSTATTNPFEAGLGRVVKLDKPGDFVGRAALEKVARDGPRETPRRARDAGPRASPATAIRSTPATAGPAS